MFGLEPDLLILLILCLTVACGFEFVNGFHDTANAVATVIYTNSLKPNTAVVWSGICNFVGVFFGGISVAMGIVNLLPVELLIDQNTYHNVAMILALLFSAIIWNLGTWYYGLPSSSSHTLIGSILGIGLAFALMPESKAGVSVNWGKAEEIGLSLIFSPIFGFSLTIILMFILKRVIKADEIFKEPKKNQPPPTWIRSILVLTCTGVSFFHGSNDGQKGVGLIMLILIGIIPAHFALNQAKDPLTMRENVARIEQQIARIDSTTLLEPEKATLRTVRKSLAELDTNLITANGVPLSSKQNLPIRRDILLISSGIKKLTSSELVNLSTRDISEINKDVSVLRTFTDYAPSWVLVIISVSLGLGTMIGWKRIVKTVGEKIGKQHLTYAQGASAELVAASTIGLATGLGLPVSTTHVLSSGIAGSMVANKGIKNLQPQTVKSIAMAWILTLPVTILLSGTLYILFRWLF